VKRSDVSAGQALVPGAKVDFLVFSDGSGKLGAEYCRMVPAGTGSKPPTAPASSSQQSSPSGVPAAGGKAKGKGKGKMVVQTILKPKEAAPTSSAQPAAKGQWKWAPAQPATSPAPAIIRSTPKAVPLLRPTQPKAAPPRTALVRPGFVKPVIKPAAGPGPGAAKGKGKGPNSSAAGHFAGKGVGKVPAAAVPVAGKGVLAKTGAAGPGTKLARTHVSALRRKGQVIKWFGQFGWVKLDQPIDHPAASKHNGDLYLHSSDMGGGAKVEIGSEVDFVVYADASGLGAESVRILPKGSGTSSSSSSGAAGVAAGAPGKGTTAGKSSAGGIIGKGSPLVGKGSVGKTVGKSTVKGVHQTISKVMTPTPKATMAARPVPQLTPVQQQLKLQQQKQQELQQAKLKQQLELQKQQRPQPNAQKGGGKKGGTGAQASSSSAAPRQDSTPLPPFWQQHYSDEYDVPYYWNSKTKESAWVRPEK